jgi:hypothetical protein
MTSQVVVSPSFPIVALSTVAIKCHSAGSTQRLPSLVYTGKCKCLEIIVDVARCFCLRERCRTLETSQLAHPITPHRHMVTGSQGISMTHSSSVCLACNSSERLSTAKQYDITAKGCWCEEERDWSCHARTLRGQLS